jgi:NAD(P)-dependent dehydrogenase (short-subunit alcohol dehydrogenase family)
MKGNPPLQAWTDSIDTILLGTINAIQAALPHLPDGASIIATGSTAAYMNAQPMMQLGTDPAAPRTCTPSARCRSTSTSWRPNESRGYDSAPGSGCSRGRVVAGA